MSLLDELKEAPSTLRLSSKFTVLNGVLYFTAGMLLIVWPGALQSILGESEFVGREAPLVRVLGMSVAVIGWLYFFGGRSGGRQFAAASVVDRIILVPLVLVPIALAGVFPRLFWAFAILDPLLGIITWYLLAGERHLAKET
jgi:hypothetical protein